MEYDFPEEGINWQEELDNDPGYQEWLDNVQRSDLSALIEEFEHD